MRHGELRPRGNATRQRADTPEASAPDPLAHRVAIPAAPGSEGTTREPWMLELQQMVESHPGVNHMMLARLATGPYTRTDYKTFGLQHYALVGFFTSYMETLLVRGPSSKEKLWLAKVLVDEYGEGSDGEDHTSLYLDFLRHAGAAEGEEHSTPLCVEAWEFVSEHLRICREEPFLVGLGALGPGHEWAIPRMFHHLVPGLRRAGFLDAEINYFLLHCEQDIDHGTWMSEVLVELATTDEARAEVRRGAQLSLEARYRLWTGVERRIVAWRQPHSLEAVRLGLHGPQRHASEVSSPGDLSALRAAVHAGMLGRGELVAARAGGAR